jgi:NitT/TauT family transport system substrate-binding protein
MRANRDPMQLRRAVGRNRVACARIGQAAHALTSTPAEQDVVRAARPDVSAGTSLAAPSSPSRHRERSLVMHPAPLSAFFSIVAALCVAVGAAGAADPQKIRFGTNWVAQAEHGGYYQAKAAGIYEAAGLDVTIRPGGPSVNTAQLLAGGALDFAILSNSFAPLNMVRENIPMVAVAAFFQKDPQCFMAHKGVFAGIEGMKKATIEIAASARDTYWPFIRTKFGLKDEQIRPFHFTLAPLLADRNVVQQCYVTVSPYQGRDAGMEPEVFLFSDYGYTSYSAVLATSQKLIDGKPELVEAFVDASIKGWYAYLGDDPSAANAMILKDNPDYTAKNLADSRAGLKEYGIVDSGDTRTGGIGAMTDARWKEFFDAMVASGFYEPSVDYRKVYTLQFVNKQVGM